MLNRTLLAFLLVFLAAFTVAAQSDEEPEDSRLLSYQVCDWGLIVIEHATEQTPIFLDIDSPADYSAVGSTFTISGTGAGLFEGNVIVEAAAFGGDSLFEGITVLHAEELGAVGDWSIEVDLGELTEATQVVVRAYSTSPEDGATIAFVSLRDGNAEIYRMNADGSDQQRITDHPNGDWRPGWQPDGTLLFTSDRNGNNDIYQVSLNTQLVGAEPLLTPLIATAADERDVAVNSRGDLLFRSDHDGSDRVYRVSADRLERSSSPYTNEPLDPYAYAYDKAALPSGHPAWVTVGGEELILLATDEENSGIIYQLPAYTLANAEGYQSIGEHLGFAGQPAGGPTWWAGETVR